MQSFSLTCHLYPKLLSCVFQAGPSICPSPGCLSSASCPRWSLMPGSVSRDFSSLLFSVCQAKGAGLMLPFEIPDSSLSPSFQHTPGPWLRAGSCLVSWPLPPAVPGAVGHPQLQIPSSHGLWIYRSLAKACLIQSLPHPCKHAGQHDGFS